jgi:hypothetical protein
VTDLGRACGRPWAQDQKLAALAAWLAVAAERQSGQGTWGER